MQCKSFSHCFNKKYWHISDSNVWNFNETLTNDIIKFEQSDPGDYLFWWLIKCTCEIIHICIIQGNGRHDSENGSECIYTHLKFSFFSRSPPNLLIKGKLPRPVISLWFLPFGLVNNFIIMAMGCICLWIYKNNPSIKEKHFYHWPTKEIMKASLWCSEANQKQFFVQTGHEGCWPYCKLSSQYRWV